MQQGRPRVERDPNERIPTSIRLRGEIFNKLSAAATGHDWSLGREVEVRLEKSFAAEADPVFAPESRRIATRLHANYVAGGVDGVMELLPKLPDGQTFEEPDENEGWLRLQRMAGKIAEMTGAASGSSAAVGTATSIAEGAGLAAGVATVSGAGTDVASKASRRRKG